MALSDNDNQQARSHPAAACPPAPLPLQRRLQLLCMCGLRRRAQIRSLRLFLPRCKGTTARGQQSKQAAWHIESPASHTGSAHCGFRVHTPPLPCRRPQRRTCAASSWDASSSRASSPAARCASTASSLAICLPSRGSMGDGQVCNAAAAATWLLRQPASCMLLVCRGGCAGAHPARMVLPP